MKILVGLGDSILARVDQDSTKALIPRLHESFPELQIKNYATGGANSSQVLELVTKIYIPSASLVAISLGMNDAAPWKKIDLDVFVSNYKKIVNACGSRKIVLITPYPVDIHKQIPPGRSNTVLQQYTDAIIELAKEDKLNCINLFQLIDSVAKHEDVHVADGIHLNDRGYTILFNSLVPLVRS